MWISEGVLVYYMCMVMMAVDIEGGDLTTRARTVYYHVVDLFIHRR